MESSWSSRWVTSLSISIPMISTTKEEEGRERDEEREVGEKGDEEDEKEEEESDKVCSG